MMFKQILLPIDLEENELTERAIMVAQDIAERYESNITVVTVIPDFSMPVVASYFPADAVERARRDACTEIEKLIKARFRDPEAVRCDVGEGSPHKFIVDYAHDKKIDLIVMPSRGRDISKIFLGSSTTHVVQRAPCSVLVIRP
ncbi:MAG: universal stress protein [Chromatiaceae bacterium]|jgi:universal stress protein F|nr:universal stress protein [Chromatiaceae bacterium]